MHENARIPQQSSWLSLLPLKHLCVADGKVWEKRFKGSITHKDSCENLFNYASHGYQRIIRKIMATKTPATPNKVVKVKETVENASMDTDISVQKIVAPKWLVTKSTAATTTMKKITGTMLPRTRKFWLKTPATNFVIKRNWQPYQIPCDNEIDRGS